MAGVIEGTDRRNEFDETMPRHRDRRRRWPWVAGGVGVAALVAGSAWVGANVVYYQPLTWGGGTDRANESSLMVSLPGQGTAHLIPVEPGAELVIWHQLHNRGHRSVRIEDVTPEWFPFALLAYVGQVMKDGSGNEVMGGWPPGQVPFEPFDLGPGEFAVVGNVYQFHECLDVADDRPPLADRTLGEPGVGTASTWYDQPVVFSVDGYRRHLTMRLTPAPSLVWDRDPRAELVDPNVCPGFVEMP